MKHQTVKSSIRARGKKSSLLKKKVRPSRLHEYKVRVSYQYESPYSGYSHNESVTYPIKAMNENIACNKARRKGEKEIRCLEHIIDTSIEMIDGVALSFDDPKDLD